jgi:hypothetical protein
MARIRREPIVTVHDKLRSEARALLAPGEEIEGVFRAQAGPRPEYLSVAMVAISIVGFLALNGAIPSQAVVVWPLLLPVAFSVKHRIGVVTADELILLGSSALRPNHPTTIVSRAPRQPLPLAGGKIWGRLTIGDQPLWVHRRFFADVPGWDATRTTVGRS